MSSDCLAMLRPTVGLLNLIEGDFSVLSAVVGGVRVCLGLSTYTKCMGRMPLDIREQGQLFGGVRTDHTGLK